MTPRLITASAFERAAKCPGSLSLPRYGDTSIHAERGTRRHAIVRALIKSDAATAAALCRESGDRDFAQAVAVVVGEMTVGASQVLVETSLAMDVRTGRVRVCGEGRAYDDIDPAHHVACTVDLAVLSDTGVVRVVDWKTGHSNVAPPESNGQMQLQSLMVGNLWGVGDVIAVVQFIRDGAEPLALKYAFDSFELAGIHDEVRTVHARAAGEPEVFEQGDWCGYCPAFAACPAKARLVTALAADPASVIAVDGEITPDLAGVALKRLRMAKEALGKVEAALYGYAAQHPIPVGGGMVWGPVLTTRETIDGKVALRVLREQYGPEVADAACEPDASKASVERAVAPLAKRLGKPVAALKREALDAIKAAGGVVVKSGTKHDEYPAGGKGAA